MKKYENEIGDPYLWNALVSDRRIFLGKKYAYAQDYNPRYNHERMLAILQLGLQRIECFFRDVQPQAVVFSQSVTLGNYLIYLFAKAYKIPILNLRPTRIQNYFCAADTMLEPTKSIQKTQKTLFENGIESSLETNAKAYLKEVRRSYTLYEGSMLPTSKPPGQKNLKQNLLSIFKLKNFLKLIEGEFKYRFGKDRDDNHNSSFFGHFVANRFIRPWRAWMMKKRYSHLYIQEKDLPLLNYAFFPLHSEPELTLLIYSKPYMNQIEAIRLNSFNLPVGMKLLVKEHPWSIGKRPLSYYKKLLEIPNVILANPSLTSRELVSHADLITVISGTTGFEALIIGKPVIVLGWTPFGFLPDCMIRHVKNPEELGSEIKDLLENYEYREKPLLCYIAAVMKESVPVDFFSILLERKEAYSPDGKKYTQELIQKKRSEHFHLLARYLLDRLNLSQSHRSVEDLKNL